MSDSTRHLRVEHALAAMVSDEADVTVSGVVARTGISRATLYRHPELIALIKDCRARLTDASTLSGLTAQIESVRSGLEAVAARVRLHEERLRDLERLPATGTRPLR